MAGAAWWNCEGVRCHSWEHYPCVSDEIDTANCTPLLTPCYPYKLSQRAEISQFQSLMTRTIILLEKETEEDTVNIAWRRINRK